ncbi:pyruvate kinase [Polynucleobacter sphagniphilus]|jgi:pyruvate kinase|uniref:pyruvate kinase n=1 Tax=Polynucleobacter sphagniphilus TaxID=1743169 RepID=UPI0024077485|nr:pyruvate kinase [Polynucleobacter sphagniphilus]MDF9788665.1 pyruvate kinase [Polynucleobacter sphagniphilus]MDH6241832.1 pyruvate kinase [Polynucleobacter sphagniphilus]MDH6249169.1 pyruvate kinase [Polynucleobacter sphagniphilus]MDH6300142.1 pyruvate kinase [Polynucleobacter sphagniphilus]MDH6421637.1 pyruvate kinase [Polynucleobacter sphagniphilus]
MLRATKIIATLGPASEKPEVLREMIRAGVDVVRMNFSHGTVADHQARHDLVRAISAEVGKEVGIMADLQGPKIRVGKFADNKIVLKEGESFILDVHCQLGDQSRVGLDYKELPGDVHPGDRLLLNDGLVVLTVEKVLGGEIFTRVEQGGPLSNNKGINRAGGGLTAPALTEKDIADLDAAIAMGIDFLAISFPKDGADMAYARKLADAASAKYGVGKVRTIAKVERAEAIVPAALESIIAESDGIMVARGDLAIEVGNAAVPALQKRMIALALEADKFTITATQMMESMINAPVPTRAEVSDVANAVLDGTDAVMLSAESAAGMYPVQTIKAMAEICVAAEQSDRVQLDTDFLDQTFTRIDQTIALGALFTAHHLNATAIAALTDSGSTPIWMSRHNIHLPIFALTSKISTQRALSTYRNVFPIGLNYTKERDAALQEVEYCLKAMGAVKSGDVVVLTSGEPMGEPGGTNTLKIIHVK